MWSLANCCPPACRTNACLVSRTTVRCFVDALCLLITPWKYVPRQELRSDHDHSLLPVTKSSVLYLRGLSSVTDNNKRRKNGVVNGKLWTAICVIDGRYYCQNRKISSITWRYVTQNSYNSLYIIWSECHFVTPGSYRCVVSDVCLL
jgi:hypothetical protein